jgi:hypothetical protein
MTAVSAKLQILSKWVLKSIVILNQSVTLKMTSVNCQK